jgi:serine/threonine protein kinase
MAKSKTESFHEAALLSSLVSHDELQQAENGLADGGIAAGLADDEQAHFVADQLVESQVLSRYQADQILGGRTKFTLGPYIIADWLGQGGMGQVFKATHEVMGREVAVKVLPVDKSTPYAIANFIREIRTQAQLDHPHLVRAHDAGHDGDVHFLVTEFVAGTDLRRLVRTHGPLSVRQAASIIMQAARGLAYAHDKNLIHRDVKPGNIMVTPEGLAKVSDLGLAGFMDATEDDPRSGKIVGTADYLSPEQIRTPNSITPSSDIYSLGCTLYYAVTGKVPFPGGSTNDKAHRHLHDHPWHPRRFNSHVTEEFVEVIADMMEKEPSKRIGSAVEVAKRLEAFADDLVSIPTAPMVQSPWSVPPLPGQEEQILDDDLVLPLDDALAQVTRSSQMSGQDTQQSEPGSIPPPPMSGVEAEPASLWDDTRVTVMVAAALGVGGLVGILFGLCLGAIF